MLIRGTHGSSFRLGNGRTSASGRKFGLPLRHPNFYCVAAYPETGNPLYGYPDTVPVVGSLCRVPGYPGINIWVTGYPVVRFATLIEFATVRLWDHIPYFWQKRGGSRQNLATCDRIFKFYISLIKQQQNTFKNTLKG